MASFRATSPPTVKDLQQGGSHSQAHSFSARIEPEWLCTTVYPTSLDIGAKEAHGHHVINLLCSPTGPDADSTFFRASLTSPRSSPSERLERRLTTSPPTSHSALEPLHRPSTHARSAAPSALGKGFVTKPMSRFGAWTFLLSLFYAASPAFFSFLPPPHFASLFPAHSRPSLSLFLAYSILST